MNTIQNNILEYLKANPSGMSVSDLSMISGIEVKTISSNLLVLVKDNILSVKTSAGTAIYHVKEIQELKEENPLMPTNDVLFYIKQFPGATKAKIYKGTGIPKNDIDQILKELLAVNLISETKKKIGSATFFCYEAIKQEGGISNVVITKKEKLTPVEKTTKVKKEKVYPVYEIGERVSFVESGTGKIIEGTITRPAYMIKVDDPNSKTKLYVRSSDVLTLIK